VLGEGAGILVLESMQHAKARGAKVLAELCGFGMTADSAEMVHPDGRAASEAMRLALEDAQLAPTDIDYVNAHGIATIAGDRNETHAIKTAFGAHAYKLAVSSTKSMYGRCVGRKRGIEAVACIKAMEEGWMPPTVGLDEADPECDLDYVSQCRPRQEARLHDVECVCLHRTEYLPHLRAAAGVSAAQPIKP
jgi:nodulation protein E